MYAKQALSQQNYIPSPSFKDGMTSVGERTFTERAYRNTEIATPEKEIVHYGRRHIIKTTVSNFVLSEVFKRLENEKSWNCQLRKRLLICRKEKER